MSKIIRITSLILLFLFTNGCIPQLSDKPPEIKDDEYKDCPLLTGCKGGVGDIFLEKNEEIKELIVPRNKLVQGISDSNVYQVKKGRLLPKSSRDRTRDFRTSLKGNTSLFSVTADISDEILAVTKVEMVVKEGYIEDLGGTIAISDLWRSLPNYRLEELRSNFRNKPVVVMIAAKVIEDGYIKCSWKDKVDVSLRSKIANALSLEVTPTWTDSSTLVITYTTPTIVGYATVPLDTLQMLKVYKWILRSDSMKVVSGDCKKDTSAIAVCSFDNLGKIVVSSDIAGVEWKPLQSSDLGYALGGTVTLSNKDAQISWNGGKDCSGDNSRDRVPVKVYECKLVESGGIDKETFKLWRWKTWGWKTWTAVPVIAATTGVVIKELGDGQDKGDLTLEVVVP